MSSLQTGHSKCVGGGSYEGCSVSNHWYGRAFDVYRVNGELVTTANTEAYAFTMWLSTLEAEMRPDEIGSPGRPSQVSQGTSTTPLTWTTSTPGTTETLANFI
ncbi:MAG: hypothetical protein M3N28_04605 [Actinomycetota bacterium]|nr:hypothetical protein [Actinomycetota bacterium]